MDLKGGLGGRKKKMREANEMYLGTTLGADALGAAHFVRLASGIKVASLLVATIWQEKRHKTK